MKSQFFRSCCVRGCAVLLGATLQLTSVGGMSPSALAESDAYKGTQYMSNATSAAQAIAQAEAVNQEIAEEGVVLLKNINSTLPLAAGKISVFGKNADPNQSVYGGSGSAASTGVGSYSLYDGLELGGFELNPALKAFYADAARSGEGRGSSPSMSRESAGYKTGETPVSAYDDELKASFVEYGDAAVFMFSRVGGEGFDLPRESKDTEGRSDPTQHYLELNDNERDLLDMVCAQYSKVIVLINSGTSMELGDLEKDERIGAILWVSMPGASGFGPIGRILNGEVNPSGRTVDTWAADFKADPTWENFCKNNANATKLDADGNVLPEYLDASGNVVTNQLYDESGALVTSKYQIAYEEGIYIGYRYWETRGYTEKAASGNDSWYREHVVYPLGYGLSYTTFTKEVVGATLDGQPVENGYLLTADDLDKQITFTVKVTNTGSVPGKDVAQLYYSAPYYDEGIEKAHVVLADFAKTSLLAAGSSEKITVSMKVRDMASYDYSDRNDNGYTTYELDCGDDAIIASIDAKGDPDMYDGATMWAWRFLPDVCPVRQGKPITYSLASGSTMPAGLTLASDGTVSGVPEQYFARTYFYVNAEAEGYTATKATVYLTIYDKPCAVQNGVMEAELTNLDGLQGSGWSGGASGANMIQMFPDASNMRAVGYTYMDGLTFTFRFDSDKQVSDVSLYVSLSSEIGTVTFNPSNLGILLNGTEINYADMTVTGTTNVVSAFKEYAVSSGLTLNEGENVVQLVIRDNLLIGGERIGGERIGGPIIDCIRVQTSANLTWQPYSYNIQ